MTDSAETNEDRTQTAAYVAAAQLADACAVLKTYKADVGRYPLHHMMNYLMTELWDHDFSQSEIRAAFEYALDDMNRYANGKERRDWPDR